MPRSGARFSAEFEAREAARWAGYTWPAFCDLDGDEQSTTIAHYRVSHQLEAVLADDQARRMKQRQSKGSK